MQGYQPDPVVKVLSGLATGLYYVAWVLAVLTLAWIPVERVVGAGRADAFYQIEAPVVVHPTISLAGGWRVPGAHVNVAQVRATAAVPVSLVPAGLVALVWLALAVSAALVLLFLHHLRRLFQRVRQGAPFDAGNAARLSWLGILLVCAAVWKCVTDFWMSLAISQMLEGGGDRLGTGVDLNLPVMLVGLVLIGLAEIFRRGAALEEEQALVV